MNVYQEVITSVFNMLSKYENDDQYEVFGFGVKYEKSTHQCLSLTLNTKTKVNGLQGILDSYKNSLKVVELHGPSYFAPAIKGATMTAKELFAKSPVYSILLIVTYGTLEDDYETKDAIVEASEAPLSIIIVCVGKTNYEKIAELERKDEMLQSLISQKIAKRNIVHFVPFIEFKYSSLQTLAFHLFIRLE